MNYNNPQTTQQRPTERQLAYIKDLNRRAGERIDIAAIRDRREASSVIDRLKAALEERRGRKAPSAFVVEEWVDGGVRP